MPDRPLAYLLTWTTRGAWIHGDERGSWQAIRGSSRADFILSKNTIDRPEPKGLTLTPAARNRVTESIHALCAHRSWTILAVNVRTNHVHAVLNPGDTLPEKVVQQLKAWSTRALRESGDIAPDQPVWTRHASTRYLWKSEHVERAVVYVRDHQEGDRFDSDNIAPNPSQPRA